MELEPLGGWTAVLSTSVGSLYKCGINWNRIWKPLWWGHPVTGLPLYLSGVNVTTAQSESHERLCGQADVRGEKWQPHGRTGCVRKHS
ncbi:hypothetical protein F3Y22_tig00110013pilonHSYRG00003 [Hibiscus syriacus]|uniref:Uncharacterized protein n=1 Tax=Hibiscus syriacus TaxID=106335 RepID=A0A6A3BPT8_HIBSY|nr:hypothetical protein F3Y22_tig00110013pilonHSYRG00003 [Hibiscus syriacus]